MKQETPIDDKNKAIAAVFYTDGSAKPNPGVATIGIHGYTYNDSPQRVKYKYDFTNLGYIVNTKESEGAADKQQGGDEDTDDEEGLDEKESNNNTPRVHSERALEDSSNVFNNKYYQVNPIDMIDCYGKISLNSNNYIAELDAVKTALKIANDVGVKTVNILTDSMAAVNCYNDWIYKWADNQWRKSDGTILKQLEYMKDLYTFIGDIKNSGIDYKLYWIPGHAGHFGNERSDQNAEFSHTLDSEQRVFITPVKKQINPNVDKPPFIYLPSLITSIDREKYQGHFPYLFTNREKKSYLYGAKSSTASYCLLLCREPIKELEYFVEAAKKYEAHMSKYLLVDVDKLYSKTTYVDIEQHAKDAFIKTDSKVFTIGTAHTPDIAQQLDTPLMVHNVVAIAHKWLYITEDAINKKGDFSVQDVTEQFYVKNTKGKNELIKDFLHNDKNKSLNIELFSQQTKQNFTPGQCFPTRSVFKNIEHLEPSVFIVKSENQTTKSWQYCFYICTQDFHMYCIPGYASTRIALNPEEIKKIKKGRQHV